MLELKSHHRDELCLSLDDRIDFIDNAIRKIDERLKVVDRVLSGQLESSISVSRTTMVEARVALISHLRVVRECYALIGCHPSVQANVLISELLTTKES